MKQLIEKPATFQSKGNSLKKTIALIRYFIKKLYRFFMQTKSGKASIALILFIGLILLRYYNAYIEIICSRKNRLNLKILRHLRPSLKSYNPSFFLFHPTLTMIVGLLDLNDNFIVKFSSEVNHFRQLQYKHLILRFWKSQMEPNCNLNGILKTISNYHQFHLLLLFFWALMEMLAINMLRFYPCILLSGDGDVVLL